MKPAIPANDHKPFKGKTLTVPASLRKGNRRQAGETGASGRPPAKTAALVGWVETQPTDSLGLSKLDRDPAYETTNLTP